MTIRYLAAAALLGSTVTAHAGGIDRSGQPLNVLFEKGRYVELSFANVSPKTSGRATAALGGFSSGDLTPSYQQYSVSFKADINDQFSYAIIYDQPFGAKVNYPAATGYFGQDAQAEFKSHALTGVLRYKIDENFSVHGGVRVQSIKANANIPFVAGYDVVGHSDYGVGYLAGVAYERPDIALRVSLTYNSKIKHKSDTVERFGGGAPIESTTTVETPQSLNLEFQTGIAKDTLLFGGLRWTDYSAFDISPENYPPGALLSYDDDVYTWSLGVGRRLNDTWAVSAALGYEKSNGGFVSNLGPTNGNKSIGVAAVYTRDNIKVTTGVRYIDIGDAKTTLGGGTTAAKFRNNDAVAIGVKVGFYF